MKTYLPIIVFLFAISCTSFSENKNSSDELSISIDTVMVDSGTELLMAGSDMSYYDVSDDKSLLYNWDQENTTIEVIDIKNLALKKKIVLEKDGPSGIGGNYFYRLDLLKNGLMGIEDYEAYRIMEENGNLIAKIKFEDGWIAEGLKEAEIFELAAINKDANLLVGVNFSFDPTAYQALLILADRENQSVTEIKLAEFQKLENYFILMESGGNTMASSYGEIFIDFLDNKLLISNAEFSSIYLLDLESKKLDFKNIQLMVSPNSKEGKYKNVTASFEEFEQILDEQSMEISFTPFFWDDSNNWFYRFSYKKKIASEEEDQYDVYASLYDKNLDLINEVQLMDFVGAVKPLFVKEGIVYFHLNVDDELAFIRMKIASKEV